MQKFLRSGLILVSLFTVSLSLRLFWLDSAPRGALIDEAHFGFLAKSILQTGKDEHGVFLPLNFKGFGDDKLPLQVYLMVPVVKLFGLSTSTIRYPSVLVGSLLPIVFYFLLKRLKFSDDWAAVGGFITAVSPWTFILSRFGFESNLALFFFSLGLYGIISFVQTQRNRYLILAAGSLALTWYAYIAYRPISILLSIIGIALLTVLKKINAKQVAAFVVVFALMIAPLFQPGVVANNSTRLTQVGIFSDRAIAMRVDEFRSYCAIKISPQLCYAASNKILEVGFELATRYFEVFSPQFLATVGEHDEIFLTVQDYGQFFRVLYPFILLGIGVLLFHTESLGKGKTSHSFSKWFLLAGLLLTPIPSVLAGHPQKVRISAVFPFLLIILMYGLRFAYQYVEKRKLIAHLAVLVFFGCLMIEVFTFYTDWFTVHTWKKGYMYQSYLPKLFEYLHKQDDNTQVVIRPFFSDPLMFYAFYTDMNPVAYQQQAVLGEKEASGFQHTAKLGRYSAQEVSLGEVGCKAVSNNQRILFVTQERVEQGVVVYSVYSENGVDPQVFVYDAKLSVDPQKCSTTPGI